MEDKLELISPERRDFVKKVIIHSAYIIPAVISVSMVDQKLELNTAYAQSGNL